MHVNVLARYGLAAAGLRWVPVEGGFSGAHVWRGEDTGPVFALKAHPPGVTPEHISHVHTWMSRAAHLPFVPAVVPTTQHATFALDAGRVWEVVRWMPGEPLLTDSPSPARLSNAVAALAGLHRAWRPPSPQLAPCPGVLRRLAVLQALPFEARRASRPLFDHARDVVSRLAPVAIRALLSRANVPLPVQPCLCDVHADHVLFGGDAVAGVIDFAAMKFDHVAVDLARLLGSTPINDDAFARAVSEYPTPPDPAFVRLLALTGTLCGVVTWCRRLEPNPAELLEKPRLRTRFQRLVGQLEAAPPAHFN